jgi:hypothetical protein
MPNTTINSPAPSHPNLQEGGAHSTQEDPSLDQNSQASQQGGPLDLADGEGSRSGNESEDLPQQPTLSNPMHQDTAPEDVEPSSPSLRHESTSDLEESGDESFSTPPSKTPSPQIEGAPL